MALVCRKDEGQHKAHGGSVSLLAEVIEEAVHGLFPAGIEDGIIFEEGSGELLRWSA